MTKSYLKTKKGTVKVTFELPAGLDAQQAVVVGEFNNWDPAATPMKRKRDGSFSASVNLASGKEYRFKYWLDGQRWENDPQPDRLVANVFGTHDSVIIT
ncbi:MAG TPA: isoamylase early set domain-containing protein [Anaerolineae bacterium]|nr:isoamylase early set domain-containing protein [Anaerolineae bacterium]